MFVKYHETYMVSTYIINIVSPEYLYNIYHNSNTVSRKISKYLYNTYRILTCHLYTI